MARTYTQDKRVGSLTTPLGADKLVLTGFSAREIMNECFEYRIEAVSTDDALVDFDRAIGKHCTLSLLTMDGGRRYYDGVLVETRWVSGSQEGNLYELVLRPWLWLLSKRTNSLIFHDKTVPDIIKEIFGKHGGLSDFRDSTSKTYPTHEYVAQYRESDMDFVCRLMEEEGICFFFEHSDGAHKLVLGDSSSAYKDMGKREFIAIDGHHRREVEHLSLWRPERKFTSGKVSLNDYNFKKPTANMKAEKASPGGYQNADLEVYDYPGRYVEQNDGSNTYARVGIDRLRAEDGRFFAEGDCSSLFPGAMIKLNGHPDPAQNKQYVITRVEHKFSGQAYRSGGGDDLIYQGRYEMLESSQPYAPPLKTPKPIARGPQTAKVVGDGEIDCDKYGRILVRFHWDRESDKSRRVRTAQVAAGNKWGAIFTPRVGMEVLIDFLEGDPDQPIVIGCVYNEDNMPPFGLPGEKNISGWKSNSTTGGGGYNEFVMDDSKGSELMRLHAQKDLDSTVENNEKRLVKVDRKTEIKNNDTLDVTNKILIKAGTEIKIECGQSSITMSPTTIKIEAPNIEVAAKLDLKTSSKITASHEATANMTIKGLLVKIN
jgi:type VI secretion system secreted protein VgrG